MDENDQAIWDMKIQKSLRNLEALLEVFTKSPDRYQAVMSDFGKLFTALSGSVPDPAYVEFIDTINDKVANYNGDGDNLKIKENASYFVNIVRNIKSTDEIVRFITEVNAKNEHRFQIKLKDRGYFTDRAEEERKQKEAEEERRRLEEEERRRMSSIEVKPKPKTLKVAFCTVCGAKFTNDEFIYCTQCGAQRHTYIVT